MNYAYARVSAKDQNLQRQIAAFSEFGIEKSRIFSDYPTDTATTARTPKKCPKMKKKPTKRFLILT